MRFALNSRIPLWLFNRRNTRPPHCTAEQGRCTKALSCMCEIFVYGILSGMNETVVRGTITKLDMHTSTYYWAPIFNQSEEYEHPNRHTRAISRSLSVSTFEFGEDFVKLVLSRAARSTRSYAAQSCRWQPFKCSG